MQLASAADGYIKPLPFRVYQVFILILAVSGLAASIYLAVSHFRVYTDVGYRSFCAISRTFNCDTVSQSTYAILLNVPVAVWGIFGYSLLLIFMALYAGPEDDRGRGWAITHCILCAFCCYSVILALISSHHINAYCIICISTYIINFALAFMVWLIKRRFDRSGYIEALKLDFKYIARRRRSTAVFAGGTVLSLALIMVYFPAYWKLELPSGISKLQSGLTEDGHPWIGNDNAPIVINEFSDYLCFQCKKMNYYLRQLISRHPDSFKLTHHHFPMDSRFNPLLKAPFHEGAGTMSLIAIHAAESINFWPVNDYLFGIAGDQSRINLNELAAKFGLDASKLRKSLKDPKTRLKLMRDIEHGLRLGITGTPSYVINGKVYHGMIPAEIIQKVQN